MLSAATGRGYWIGDDLGWVLGAGAGQLYVLSGRDYPTLAVIAYDLVASEPSP
jgi:hypothetical protein